MQDMSFIEGIGDEVTLFFVIVIVFSLAALVTLIGSSPTLSRTRQRWRGEVGNESVRETAIPRQRLSSSRHSPNSQAINEFVNSTRYSPNSEATNELVNSSIQSPNSQAINESVNSDQHINNSDTLNNFSDNQIVNGVDRNLETEAEISASNDPSSVEDNSTSVHSVVDENTEQHNLVYTPASSLQENITPEDLELRHIQRGEIRVRLKYLDDTEKTVITSLNTTIGDFKKKHFEDDLRSNKIVRLIFAGHLLNNSSTVEHCRILDNSVVHVQVLSAPATESAPIVNQERELDLGFILWPVLTVILSLCWLTYFKYPEFYNSLSLGVLLLFSGCYFYFLSQIR